MQIDLFLLAKVAGDVGVTATNPAACPIVFYIKTCGYLSTCRRKSGPWKQGRNNNGYFLFV